MGITNEQVEKALGLFEKFVIAVTDLAASHKQQVAIQAEQHEIFKKHGVKLIKTTSAVQKELINNSDSRAITGGRCEFCKQATRHERWCKEVLG